MKEAIITKLGIIPIAYKFIEELEIPNLLGSHIESGEEGTPHGKALNVMILNLLGSPPPYIRLVK